MSGPKVFTLPEIPKSVNVRLTPHEREVGGALPNYAQRAPCLAVKVACNPGGFRGSPTLPGPASDKQTLEADLQP